MSFGLVHEPGNIRFSNFSTDKKVQETLWDLCGVMAVRKDTSMVKSPRLNTREPPAIPPKCVIFVVKLRDLGPTPQKLWDTPFFSWKNPMFIYTAWLMGHVLGHWILSLGGGKSIYGEKFEDDSWWIKGVGKVDDLGVMIRFSIVDFPWPPPNKVYFFFVMSCSLEPE